MGMISREILKKIRQIELPANRIVNETLAGALFQPSAQFLRVARPIKHGNDADVITFDVKINAVSMEFAEEFCLADRRAGKAETFGIFQNFLDDTVDFSLKFVAQTGLLFIIPKNC